MLYTLKGDAQDIARVEEGTAALLKDLPGEAVTIHVSLQEDAGLSVSRSEQELSVTCREPAHYFRGLWWAVQHTSAESGADGNLTLPVIFPKNGMMLDCSRNAVCTVKKVKSIIETMAKLGMNLLLLYTEETYTVPEQPYFGIYRGRYSKEEIREIDRYAAAFGIELVPCIQTLAHLRNFLRWPIDPSMKDNHDILMVGNDKVYTLLEEMLAAVKDSFSTRRVHLGMDEAVSLGLGNYLAQNGYKESSAILEEHCSRVLAICEKLGLEPMIWSDMYITSNNGASYYDVDENTDTSDWKKPAPDLGLVYWDYYHEDDKIYCDCLRIHKELTNRLSFAGGLWNWNGISPNYSKAFGSILPGLRSCKKYEVPEVFVTAWMDNGAETPIDTIYPGMVLFAHLGFHEEPDQAALEEEFRAVIGGELSDFYALDGFDALFTGIGKNFSTDNPSKYFLYQDTLLGMFDYHAADVDTAAYYTALAGQMQSARTTSPRFASLFAYYEKLALVLADKAGLGIRIKDAYDRQDLSTLKQICEEVIPTIRQNLVEMKDLRQDLWLADAKPFGYELLDIKIGGVITRLDSNKRRLESYLNGTVPALEELEQPRLPYFPTEKSKDHDPSLELRENQWDRIVSGCCLVDTI